MADFVSHGSQDELIRNLPLLSRSRHHLMGAIAKKICESLHATPGPSNTLSPDYSYKCIDPVDICSTWYLFPYSCDLRGWCSSGIPRRMIFSPGLPTSLNHTRGCPPMPHRFKIIAWPQSPFFISNFLHAIVLRELSLSASVSNLEVALNSFNNLYVKFAESRIAGEVAIFLKYFFPVSTLSYMMSIYCFP